MYEPITRIKIQTNTADTVLSLKIKGGKFCLPFALKIVFGKS